LELFAEGDYLVLDTTAPQDMYGDFFAAFDSPSGTTFLSVRGLTYRFDTDSFPAAAARFFALCSGMSR